METHGRSEHERIVELEQRLPEIAVAVADVRGLLERLAGQAGGSFPAGGGVGPGVGALLTAAAGQGFVPFLPAGALFWYPVPQDTFESAGAAAGRLVDDAKELIDAAKRLEDAVGDLGELTNDPKRAEGRRKLKELADAVAAALQKGREARRAVRGAATAAKSHKAVRAALQKARESFDEAQRLLDQYQRQLAQTPANAPNLNALKQQLADARKKVSDDLGHLQDALDAIV